MSIRLFTAALVVSLSMSVFMGPEAWSQDSGEDSSRPAAEAGSEGEGQGEVPERPSPAAIVMPGVEEGPGALEGGKPAESGAAAKARQEAFEKSLQELLPTSPEQIQKLRQKVDQREKALSDTPPPVVHTRTECVSLQPGFAPPKIELTPNLVSVLVVVDQAGKPWPITSTTLGSGALFTAQVLDTPAKNQVVLSALSSHGNSNFVLTLAGQEIPLVVLLETKSGIAEGRETDGMIVYQVMSRGPNAPPPAIKKPVTGPVPDVLYTILDGITPPGAKLLKFFPQIEDTRIYQLDETLYLRTRHQLMWPSYRAQVAGVGDYNVYEIQAVPSLMISLDGQISRVELRDSEPAAGGN